jgi:hypothetical protein
MQSQTAARSAPTYPPLTGQQRLHRICSPMAKVTEPPADERPPRIRETTTPAYIGERAAGICQTTRQLPAIMYVGCMAGDLRLTKNRDS